MKQVQKGGDNCHQVQIGGKPETPEEFRRRIARPYALFALSLPLAAVAVILVAMFR